MESVLDEFIDNKRAEAMKNGSIENVSFSSQDDIYRAILIESDNLIDGGKYKKNISLKYRFKVVWIKIKSGMKKIDSKLRKYDLYENGIRRVLVHIKHAIKQDGIVDVMSLMECNDKEFVEALYRELLDRESDSQGVLDNVDLLKSKKISRIEMIEIFYNSHERVNYKKLKGYNRAKNKYGIG